MKPKDVGVVSSFVLSLLFFHFFIFLWLLILQLWNRILDDEARLLELNHKARSRVCQINSNNSQEGENKLGQQKIRIKSEREFNLNK